MLYLQFETKTNMTEATSFNRETFTLKRSLDLRPKILSCSQFLITVFTIFILFKIVLNMPELYTGTSK